MNSVWLWAALAVVWIACGIFNYGASLAFWQRKFPTIAYEQRRADVHFALWTALLGPIGLIPVFLDWKHGFMWTTRETVRREVLETLFDPEERTYSLCSAHFAGRDPQCPACQTVIHIPRRPRR